MAAMNVFVEFKGKKVRWSNLFAPESLGQLWPDLLKWAAEFAQMATVAESLLPFEPDQIGDRSSRASETTDALLQFLEGIPHEVKYSFFYVPAKFSPPFVQVTGCYMAIKASLTYQKTLQEAWDKINDPCLDGKEPATGGKKAEEPATGGRQPQAPCLLSWESKEMKEFNAMFPGAAKSSKTEQWLFILRQGMFEDDELPSMENEAVGKLFPEGGIKQTDFAKCLFGYREVSFDELDAMIKHQKCALKPEWLSPYLTFTFSPRDAGGAAFKYHDLQFEFADPLDETDTVVSKLVDPSKPSMVLDLILWKGSGGATKGEYAKIGYYIMEDGRKVVNIVPPFPQSLTAVKKKAGFRMVMKTSRS